MKFALPLFLLILFGCDSQDYDPDLNRMLQQPSAKRWEYSEILDGSVIIPPQSGTVAREAALPDPAWSGHLDDGNARTRFPWRVNEDDLHAGMEHFMQQCAPCHGVLGNGDSYVAERMHLVKPRDLTGTAMQQAAVGHLYSVASDGYGLMQGYASALSPRERWQVVAYIRVLQWSREVDLSQLSAAQRQQIQERLP